MLELMVRHGEHWWRQMRCEGELAVDSPLQSELQLIRGCWRYFTCFHGFFGHSARASSFSVRPIVHYALC